jgi:hypothetical protein
MVDDVGAIPVIRPVKANREKGFGECLHGASGQQADSQGYQSARPA